MLASSRNKMGKNIRKCFRFIEYFSIVLFVIKELRYCTFRKLMSFPQGHRFRTVCEPPPLLFGGVAISFDKKYAVKHEIALG